MKVRDSGMPDEEMWTGFFDSVKVLAVLGLNRGVQNLVEFGCGYGTFTMDAALLFNILHHEEPVGKHVDQGRDANEGRIRC